MMNPAAFAIRQPRVVLLATVLFIVYGVLSYLDLPRQENPTLPDRFASVATYLPGAEPEKIERLVSKVLEEEIAKVDDLEDIFSTSTNGRSYIVVEVKKGAPLAQRIDEVRDKVQEARSRLPEGASEPEVDTETLNTYTMILVVTARGVGRLALRHEAEELERELELLPGVRRVDLVGNPEEEIEVAVDLRKLSQRGVPLTRVVSALAERNVILPGGNVDIGAVTSNIRTTGAYGAMEEVGATLMGTGATGLPIRLSDVARIERRIAEPEVLVRTSGASGVALAVEMLKGRDAIAFGERVRAFLAAWEQRLPEGLVIEIVADEPTYVRARLALLTGSLVAGLVIVVGLTLLGMGWRSGAIVSVSIPLSITVSMSLLGLFGLELHQISIAALVIAIGLVVDEAIVVTDNIQRHLDRGVAPTEASIQGLGEIHLAVLAGAATTVAAFIPLMLMEGDIGDFLRSIPVAASLMLLASVTVAHFVTPLLAAFVHGFGQRARSRTATRLLRRFEMGYRQFLGGVVSRAPLVLALFAMGFAASLVVLVEWLLPPRFFPSADRHQFLVEATLPDGAPLEETDVVMAEIAERIARVEQVRDWTAFIGADAPKFYYNEFGAGRAENIGMFIVNTKESLPFHRTHELVERLDTELKAKIAGARVRARELAQGYSNEADVRIHIQGDSLERLRLLSRRVREIAAGVSGVAQVRESFGFDPLTFEARVDAAKANAVGITHRDVATTLRTAIDGLAATAFREDDEEIDIVVRLAEGQRRSVEDLHSLGLFSPTAGRAVPLSQVATLEPSWTARQIERWNRKRQATIEADVAGRPVVSVTNDIERAVHAELRVPDGYSISFRGQRKEVSESFVSMAKAAVVAIFLIYIILVLRFGSLSQPALIVLAVPMALIGAILGLAATGNPLSLTAFLGMIALTGIVVNDSIVLLDYINTLRGRGDELEDAVMTGATTRLRAVTLTSLTTMGGLFPLTLTGGAFWQPFGVSMIFGLAASTVLTLLVQPTAYLLLERRKRRRREMRGECFIEGYCT
jgi:multidrug efflux pump subunit AcrB